MNMNTNTNTNTNEDDDQLYDILSNIKRAIGSLFSFFDYVEDIEIFLSQKLLHYVQY